MKRELVDKLSALLKQADTVVIVQADNPDGDSMGSALALELILGKLGKEPYLYCAVDTPSYLRYMAGWDRIVTELPNTFDASIIVDTSTKTLLEKVLEKGDLVKLAKKPSVVLDHHGTVEDEIDFADVLINDSTVSSTGELLYSIAKQLDWPIPVDAAEHIMTSILGDTQGLSNDLAQPSTYRTMAELVELGVNRPQLEEKRRAYSKMPESIFRYKGRLIERTKLELDGRLAFVHIPHQEIINFSPLYNPAPLIQSDMLQIEGVVVSTVLKNYNDGKVTGAIRCSNGFPIAGKLAEALGGGGHPYAAGFKVTDGSTLADVQAKLLEESEALLQEVNEQGDGSETL